MAKGMQCQECNKNMYVKREKVEPMGTTVWYECQNMLCQSVKRGYPWSAKVFEGK